MATNRKKHVQSKWKQDRRKILITQLLRFDYGKVLIHRVLAPVSFVLSLFTLLKVYNLSFGFSHMVLLAAVTIAAMFILGFIWDKGGFVEEEIEYTNERNRFVHVMLDGNKRTRKQWLKKLQKAKIVK